jgi:hypothetical protein
MALDPMMAAFESEMRARPRPRRASTRRAEQVDNLSGPGAQRLCQMIKRPSVRSRIHKLTVKKLSNVSPLE